MEQFNKASYGNDSGEAKLKPFGGMALSFDTVTTHQPAKTKPSGGIMGLLNISSDSDADKKWNEVQNKQVIGGLQMLDLDSSDDEDDDHTYDGRTHHADVHGMKRAGHEYHISNNGTLQIDNFNIKRINHRSNSKIQQLSVDDLREIHSLGAGAGGSVMKCLHVPSQSYIALKSIDVIDVSKRDQLVRELKELDECASPYLVNMLNLYYHEGQIHIALEYMDRGSLQSVIDKYGALSEPVVADIARQSLLGLMHMHSLKKVHRDIKPGNILVNQHGEVKISDFGIAAQLEGMKDQCNTFVGTVVYMSPERLDSQSYSYPGDIWSLGLTLMFCAMGCVPIETKGGYWAIFSRLRNDEPPRLPDTGQFSFEFRDFIAKCLAKEPNDRWDVAQLLLHPFIKTALGPRRTIPYWPESMDMQSRNRDVKGNSGMMGTLNDITELRRRIIDENMKKKNPNSQDANDSFSNDSYSSTNDSYSGLTDPYSGVNDGPHSYHDGYGVETGEMSRQSSNSRNSACEPISIQQLQLQRQQQQQYHNHRHSLEQDYAVTQPAHTQPIQPTQSARPSPPAQSTQSTQSVQHHTQQTHNPTPSRNMSIPTQTKTQTKTTHVVTQVSSSHSPPFNSNSSTTTVRTITRPTSMARPNENLKRREDDYATTVRAVPNRPKSISTTTTTTTTTTTYAKRVAVSRDPNNKIKKNDDDDDDEISSMRTLRANKPITGVRKGINVQKSTESTTTNPVRKPHNIQNDFSIAFK